MAVTPDTVVVGVEPDITSKQFEQILQAAGSPAEPTARSGYSDIIDLRVSPAFALAIFKHESRFGKEGLVPLYNLKNPGARRTTRTGEGVEIQIPGRGQFVRYPSWTAGWTDLAFSLVDPDFVYVREGRRTIRKIIERWAPPEDGNAPESYISAVVRSMNEWIGGAPMAAQIPGFRWEPADADHFAKGRGQKIRGFAVHYTAGSNSLPWLTRTSQPPVSAHFLIKHNPTMEDRGWQLVRIEDTAWTTALANRYTVSFEYEHKQGQPIPDVAYQVMAQTILDVSLYVAQHGLGEIPIRRGDPGIEGHKFWVGNPDLICPDGIDVDRIVSIAQGRVPEAGERSFPETGYAIRGRIRSRWEDMERAGLALPMVGFPVSEEYEVIKDGKTVVRQEFERMWLEYDKDALHPWDVTGTFVSDIEDEAFDPDNLHAAVSEHVRLVEESIKTLKFAL